MSNANALNDNCDLARRTPDVAAYLHPFAKDLLQRPEFLFQMKQLHNGPVHLIFPHIMRENIQKMQNTFAKYSFQTAIYYSCKPNKSKVFLREAHAQGINVDVSSVVELATALAAGFRGQDIGCTNLKNDAYLRLAIEHGCLISADSFCELQQIASLYQNSRYKEKCRVLLRIADLKPKDRKLAAAISKFGIPVSQLSDAVSFILAHQDVFSFQGLHFHRDNPLADVHAGYIDHALTLITDIERNYNLASTYLDIGGGFRTANIENAHDWGAFISHVSQGLVSNQDTGTWNNQAYGMKLADKGGVNGRAKLEARARTKDYSQFIDDVFENTLLRGRPLHRVISDNLLTVIIEPGASLLAQAGLTLMHINGAKRLASCDNAVYVDGNIYNISGQFMDQITDFIHVPQKLLPQNTPYDAYIIDNLCNERGVLSQKCMYFDQQPVAGDLLIIPNTAAYLSDFEDAAPHMHPQGKKIVVTPSQSGEPAFFDEDYYYAFK